MTTAALETAELLVADAIAAREEAEQTEAEASPSRWREADSYAKLSGLGWTQQQIAEACGTTQSSVSKFISCAARYSVANSRPSFWEAYREVDGKNKLDVHMSSATPEWETPQDLFDALDSEFHFTLDVCASPGLEKCERFYSPDDDGLTMPWDGVCWMNPPYGDDIPQWIARAHLSADAGTTVVCLVPARTDTAWWWDHCIHGEIRFLRGRLKFGGAETSAPFPSAVVVFGHVRDVVWWEWR